MAVEEAMRSAVDLEPFRALTAEHARWSERTALIRKVFPSVVSLDWSKLCTTEPEVVGTVLRDVLKAMQATPGKPGPRPSVAVEEARPIVDEWMGRDYKDRPYSTLPFPQAFRIIVRPNSIRQAARKLEWCRQKVFRLMAGQAEPTPVEMEHIAEVYHKRPSFFIEYRVGWAVAVFLGAMEAEPDRTIRVYESLRRAVG